MISFENKSFFPAYWHGFYFENYPKMSKPMSSSDSDEDSFLASSLASSAAPPAAAAPPPPTAGPAPTPELMLEINSETSQFLRAPAKSPGQNGSTSTLAALKNQVK